MQVDIYSVIGYYLRQRSEVEAYLQQRRRQADRVRKQNVSRFDPAGIRERLEAQRASGQQAMEAFYAMARNPRALPPTMATD
jgi:hypothetical protein